MIKLFFMKNKCLGKYGTKISEKRIRFVNTPLAISLSAMPVYLKWDGFFSIFLIFLSIGFCFSPIPVKLWSIEDIGYI